MIFVSGQVAQLVERSPEKAGVGGSIPSLATTFSNTYNHFRLYAINGGSPPPTDLGKRSLSLRGPRQYLQAAPSQELISTFDGGRP